MQREEGLGGGVVIMQIGLVSPGDYVETKPVLFQLCSEWEGLFNSGPGGSAAQTLLTAGLPGRSPSCPTEMGCHSSKSTEVAGESQKPAEQPEERGAKSGADPEAADGRDTS